MAILLDSVTFGKSVRKERHARKLTLEDLAGLTGLSERQIQNIELKESNPKLSTINAIAHALGYRLEFREDNSRVSSDETDAEEKQTV